MITDYIFRRRCCVDLDNNRIAPFYAACIARRFMHRIAGQKIRTSHRRDVGSPKDYFPSPNLAKEADLDDSADGHPAGGVTIRPTIKRPRRPTPKLPSTIVLDFIAGERTHQNSRAPKPDTPSPPNKGLGFRGFGSSKLFILKGGIPMPKESYRGSRGKFDSRTLRRETLSRWAGRIMVIGWSTGRLKAMLLPRVDCRTVALSPE